MTYFSERELSSRPRTKDQITPSAWSAIVVVVKGGITDGSFGQAFPFRCEDGEAVVGTDFNLMGLVISKELPYLRWPLDEANPPETFDVLDFIHFCHTNLAKPIPRTYHPVYDHHHLSFEPDEGKREFRAVVNRIFLREQLAYELRESGEIQRLAPILLGEALTSAVFGTGDATLDSLLESARTKFLSHDPDVRKEALERLWDAWERLKTLEEPANKKQSSIKLLEQAAPDSATRRRLEVEAKELTDIGNQFMIRHTEVGKIPINSPEMVDYLFHRMFSLIRFLLRTTGRGG